MDTRGSLKKAFLFNQNPCVYCGTIADSKDHAPSRCLLRSPLPSTLITLPACKRCNANFSFSENVVKTVITLISTHSELVTARKTGGTTYRALERDRRIRSLINECRRSDGGIELRGELLDCFERVFIKTVQGLFFGLYQRVVAKEQLSLVSIEDR